MYHIVDAIVGGLLYSGAHIFIDLPEVSLVAILDADNEGFLRSHRSLTQTAGRAARNVNGLVIFYANKITDSMKRTMDETARRRDKQMRYNQEHGITPTQIKKSITNALAPEKKENDGKSRKLYGEEMVQTTIACDPIVEYMSAEQLRKSIERTRRLMEQAAEKMEFIEAAQYRDEMFRLQEILKSKE